MIVSISIWTIAVMSLTLIFWVIHPGTKPKSIHHKSAREEFERKLRCKDCGDTGWINPLKGIICSCDEGKLKK